MRRRLAPARSPWRAVAAIVLHPVEQDPRDEIDALGAVALAATAADRAA